MEGLVAAVDGGQVVLNVGGKAGLKVGDQLTVQRVTREIKDPATGQVIRRMTSPVGVIRLTDVDDVLRRGHAGVGLRLQGRRCREYGDTVGVHQMFDSPPSAVLTLGGFSR